MLRWLVLAAAAAGAVGVPVVQTASGPVLGIATPTGGAAYLGIPYAAPPLRWGPPRPPAPWSTPLNASSFGAGCVSFRALAGAAPQSEDCLVVHVFVPKVALPGAPLIVWIHGGGFVGGNAQGDLSTYAEGVGAVVVSIEYRLGSAGFLALPGMAPAFPTPSAADAACANVGLLDQQAGLQWAHANAAAFGADPAHILLTGQSAGGSSVLFQLTLPGSYGAYRAALVQSPGSPTNTLAAGAATARAIAARLGCGAGGGFAAQLACLRAVPVDALVAAALAVAGTGDLPLTLGPVIDGALVAAAPAAAMLAGSFNRDATIVVSETLFEGDSLLVGFTHAVELNATQAAAALAQLGTSVGFNASELQRVGAAYAAIGARDGYFNASSRIWGDGLIACAAAWAARGAAAYSVQPVRRLLYNTTLPGQPAGRATHGTDLAYLFGRTSIVSNDIWGWLGNLAVTGDVSNGPAGKGVVEWPAYGGSGGAILTVNEARDYSVVPAWQEDLCDAVWLDILP